MRGSFRSVALATVFACVAQVAPVRGQDFSYDILPPGQYGNLPTTVHSTDPGFIPETMRFTNRSTFQQVIRFARP